VRSLSRRAIAYHEAGHAVVMEAVGVRVRRATIVPSKYESGSVCPHEGESDPASQVLIDLVGVLAERRAAGRRPRLTFPSATAVSYFHVKGDLIEYGAAVDGLNAWEAAAVIAPSHRERTAYLRWQWERAAAMVERRWVEVEAVAAALLKRKTLYGSEVRRVIRAAHLRALGERIRAKFR